ncbi:MAG TPA: nucleotide-binding protein [Vicinamibacteria bacterium]|nr:nucleotide-binding protein [Vicinamibacteria bacterium]
MRSTAPLFVAAVAVSLACRGNTPEPARDAAASPAAAAAALSRPSPEDRAVAAAEAEPPDALTGEVLETMDAGGYTYLRLDTSAGPAWAAVERSDVKKGARVTVMGSVAMDGFESRTLGRRFDRIVFGALTGEEPQAGVTPPRTAAQVPPAMAAALAAQHAAAASGPAEVGPVKVSRVTTPDGRTVAEVFAERAALDTKAVAVRGKVVKFLPGIMGRNWLHLRDGTGSPEGKDYDLTVTTSETVAVGEVVLVRGTVRKDLDFGAGYSYAVLVEEAKLSR